MSQLPGIQILVAEDNPGDAYLLKRAISHAASNCSLHFLSDGDQAFRFLSHLDPYRDAPRPDVIVLDLNLPKRDGIELLELVRNTDALRGIPIIVLSSAPEELARKSLQATDRYIKKPMTLEAFMRIGREIVEWHQAVQNRAKAGLESAHTARPE